MQLIEPTININEPETLTKINVSQYVNDFAPEKFIDFQPKGYLRYNLIGELTIRAAKIKSNTDGFYRFNKIKVSLEFEPPFVVKRKFKDSALKNETSGFGKVLYNLVQNFEGLSIFADPSPPIPQEISIKSWTPLSSNPENFQWIKIQTSNEGFFTIGCEDLKKAGIEPQKYSPDFFHILDSEGREIPIFILGGLSENFTNKDYLLFYAQKPNSPFTSKNIYWLFYDTKTKSLKMKEFEADEKQKKTPSDFNSAGRLNCFVFNHRVEKDESREINSGNFLSIKGMKWVWGRIPPKGKFSVNFDLPNLIKENKEIAIKYNFFILSEGFISRSGVRVSLNDNPKGEFRFTTESDESFTTKVLLNSLKEQGNHLEIEYISPKGKEEKTTPIFFDCLELQYPKWLVAENNTMTFKTNEETSAPLRIYTIKGFTQSPVLTFDITDKRQPQYFKSALSGKNELEIPISKQGSREIISFSIESEKNKIDLIKRIKKSEDIIFKNGEGADYLIIYHEIFFDALAPFIKLKNNMGFRVYPVDVETLYDKYTGGLESPIAVKKFLNDAFRVWDSPKPAFVLLVGDCTSDYIGLARNDVINYVPSYSMSPSHSSEQQKWASDKWFTYLTGEDIYSDLMIGRISVNNIEDAKIVVNKIINYQTKPQIDTWRARIGYISDNGPFEDEVSKLTKEDLPPEYEGVLISLNKMPWEDNFYLPRDIVEQERSKVSPKTTKMILDHFTSGSVITTFFGHGSPNIWADERIWFGGDSFNSDNLLLTNYNRLAFVLNMTCNSGAIDYPVSKWNICISEDMMRVKDGGAIGLYVPSGPGFTSAHINLSKEFANAVFHKNIKRLGEVILFTEARFLSQDSNKDIPKMYILLGDPSLELQVPSNKIPVTINKKTILWEKGGDIKASLKLSSYPSAEAEFSLFDPNRIRVGAPQKINLNQGIGEVEFNIPPKSKRGKWYVYVYVKSEKNNWDAVGGTQFLNDIECITLKKFERKKISEESGVSQNAALLATVKNLSFLPIEKCPIELSIESPNDKETLIEKKYISLKPEEEKIIEWDVVLKNPLDVFKVKLPEKILSPDPELEIIDHLYLGAFYIPQDNYGLFLSQSELCWDIKKSEKKYSLSLTCPIYNLSPTPQKNVIFEVSSSNLNIIQEATQKIPEIGSGLRQEVNFTIDSDFSIEKKNEYRIKIAKSDENKDGNKENNVVVFKYSPDLLPDLCVDKDDTYIEPSTPVEGHTIFIHTKIKNIGKGPARNFAFGVYTENPAEKESLPKQVESMAYENDLNIKYLAPNSVVKKMVRWDPIKNRRIDKLWIMVNPNKSIVETDFENNIFIMPLKVLRKGNVKPRGITMKEQTPEERRNNEMWLVASFFNDGDVSMKKVFIVFFSQREQIPENEIGRVLIDEVKSHILTTAEIKWKYKPGVSYQPSLQIFIKGSNQRITSTEVGEEKD